MFRVPLATSKTTLTLDKFWNSVLLYHSSPHLVNRRILSISQLFFLKVKFNNDFYKINDILKYSSLYSQILRLESINSNSIDKSIITNIFDQYKNQFEYEKTNSNEIKNSPSGTFISVRILLPRNMKFQKSVEVVIIDKEEHVASFLAVSKSDKIFLAPKFQYDLELDKSNLFKICVLDIDTAEEKGCEWLADILFTKLLSWTEKYISNNPVQKSLSLISEEKYCNLYHELKLKYGDNIITNWPENTDPLKFVYEDIAIAAYLLTLWNKISKFKQKFVDLGCGNGLLVHILSQEGHEGYGIDVRPRKIWKMFPDTTILKVETIIPSSSFLFPETNWLIGNHSDELSPWVPVIAARSSQDCKFFLLPCCSYEFSGKKYQRQNSSQSQYQEYLQYVKSISDTCGFKTKIDRLRIPSTKRICLVGAERKYTDFKVIDEQITNLINSRCGSVNNETKNWVDNYEARSSIEVVRNCTKLNRDLLDKIVAQVVSHLLSHKNYVTTSLGKNWNTGGIIHLSNLVKIIDADDLKQLKSECGGLQTLLKNHHFIFLVQNGTVQLRMPTNNGNRKFIKNRECWFHRNHPDGCTLLDDACTYIHC